MGNNLWLKPQFGSDYIERNPITDEAIQARCIFFSNVLNIIKSDGRGDFPAEILEVGAGQGQNIVSLEKIVKVAEIKTKLEACEPYEPARAILRKNLSITNIHEFGDMLPVLPLPSYSKELVFTSGVLIHVPSNELIPSMRELYRVSSRYILCMEYFSPVERRISYHGEEDALWLRDYGSVYLDNFKLKLLGFGFCWKRVTLMDNVTWFLFEKVH
jgi:hypothetical protein